MNRAYSWIKVLSTWCVGLLCALAFGNAAAVSGAAFTTVNPNADGNGTLCLNGNPLNNCNIYTSKSFVWLNGGPATAYVGDGNYFFTVLDPGGQNDPNNGSPLLAP